MKIYSKNGSPNTKISQASGAMGEVKYTRIQLRTYTHTHTHTRSHTLTNHRANEKSEFSPTFFQPDECALELLQSSYWLT